MPTTEPSQITPWIWTNLDTKAIVAGLAAVSLVLGIVSSMVYKAGIWIIGCIFGWKSEWKRKQEELEGKVNVLAKAASSSPTPPEVQAKIDEMAATKP